MIIEEVRQEMLAAIDAYEEAPFAWPDDRCCGAPWAYWVHVYWVNAWNREGRKTPCIAFLRAWLTDENIDAALNAKKAFARGAEQGPDGEVAP